MNKAERAWYMGVRVQGGRCNRRAERTYFASGPLVGAFEWLSRIGMLFDLMRADWCRGTWQV
jgi:hypothetical protein